MAKLRYYKCDEFKLKKEYLTEEIVFVQFHKFSIKRQTSWNIHHLLAHVLPREFSSLLKIHARFGEMEGELINVYGVTWKWTNFECVYTFLNPLLSCHECMVGNLLPFIWISTNNFQMNEFVNFHLFNLLFVKAPRWWTAELADFKSGGLWGGSWILHESALCWCHQRFMWPNFPPLFNL